VDHVKSGIFLLAASLALTGQDGKLSANDAKNLKNPVPFTKKSISKGRDSFLRNCVGCHGDDGKALIDVVANATDLTDPKAFRDGTSEGEIFRSIRDGAGASMPSFKSEIGKDDDLWNLVNFIHSLWPPEAQPPLKDKD
jgi:mono/diheme cytochrome c family protein